MIPLDALSYLGIFVRRNWLLLALLISGLACAPGATRTTQAPAAASTGTASRPLLPALRVAADSFLALSESQQRSGVWPDLSDETRLSGQARLDRIAVELRSIDRDRLPLPSDELLYDNLRESVDASVASRICRTELWAITNQFTGWHVAASNVARVQSVGSGGARSTALMIFRALPAVIAAEWAMLQRGLDSGYTASRAVTAAVVRQYDDLLPPDPERSPLFAPAVRDSTSAFRAAWRARVA